MPVLITGWEVWIVNGDLIGRPCNSWVSILWRTGHFCVYFSHFRKTLHLTFDQAWDSFDDRVGIFIESSAFFQFQIATVTEKGVEIEGPLSAETNWDIAHMIRWLKLKLQWNSSWEIPGCSKVGFSGGLNQKFSGWQGFGLKIELFWGLKIELFWGTDFSLYGFMILSSLFLVALNEIQMHYPELKLYPSSNFEPGWFKGTLLL